MAQAANQQLEAALRSFAGQQSVTADQAAQLRDAIVSDRQLLQQLNQQAQAGHLRSFSLEAANSHSPSLIGSYDMQSGSMALPRAALAAPGAVAGADLKATLQVQQMSVEFAHTRYQDSTLAWHPVTQEMVNNLQATINGSPVVADEIKKAATTIDQTDRHSSKRAQLEHFGFVGPGASAGGTYDGGQKTMNLPPIGLQSRTPANPAGRYIDGRDLTFVLGHEIQHSFNHADKTQRSADFIRDIGVQARAPGATHDYTDELRAYIQAGREDEAKAQIAGWNALLSREKQSNPNVGVVGMETTRANRVYDFVTQSTHGSPTQIRPGYNFDPDGYLQQTPANIAAAGQHYFDRPSQLYAQPGQRPVAIGEHKDLAGNLSPTADYANYYGAWAVERILEAERSANVTFQGAKPTIAIDMAALGLRENLIENEGLNLGRQQASQPYLDISQTPAAPGRFDHTQDGRVNPAHDHQHVPVAPTSGTQSHSASPADALHPAHATLQQIRSGVAALGHGPWSASNEAAARVEHALLAASRDHREAYPGARDVPLSANALGRVDHVVASADQSRIFAVEGDLRDPTHRRAMVDVQQALGTPVEQSDAKLQSATQQIGQEQQRAQQETLTRQHTPTDGTRDGPVQRH